MNLVELLKEVTARSTVLWGVAIASILLFLTDRWITPLSIQAEWWWVLPVTAYVFWSIIVTGLVATAWPKFVARWNAPALRRRRNEYALMNVGIASKFQRMVLLHYKRRGQQRFRAPGRQRDLHDMVRHGFMDNDSFDRSADMQHYRITDCVWRFLDAPPRDWDPQEVFAELDWDR